VAPIGLRRQVYLWEIRGLLEGPFAWLRRCRQSKFAPEQELVPCPPMLKHPQKT